MPIDRPTVTVLVPTYNRAAYLPEALEGILGQTLAPDQVIVVDDGSTEDIASIAARYGDRVAYLRQENAGKSVALNRGLAEARGEAIWIFDDDDVPEPDTLERLAAALATSPDAGFAYGQHDYLVRSAAGWRVEPLADPNPDNEALNVAVLRQCLMFQPGMLIRARCLAELGPFDETLLRSQDYDMLLRLVRRYPGVKVDGVVFHQRKHEGARGPARQQGAANRRGQVWGAFDRLIFERLHADYRLDEFLPAGETPSGDSEALALATRAAVMARRGLWAQAAADLEAVGARLARAGRAALDPEERRHLAAVFDWAGYGLQSLGGSAPFFAALRGLPVGIRRSVCGAVAEPLPRRLKVALRRGRADEAKGALQAGLALGRAWL